MNNNMQTPNPHQKRQQGFTLLELLVVVSVLAALAGIAAVAMDGYEQEAQEQLVQVEMKRIANAIYRFKEDTGYFPEKGVFPSDSPNANSVEENLEWLFTSPTNGSTEILPWNPNSGRGWNGPYLTPESQSKYGITTSNKSYCGSKPSIFTGAINSKLQKTLVTVADTFERRLNNTDDGPCFAIRDDGYWIPKEFSGQPYRYNTHYYASWLPDCPDDENTCIAIVSAGKDSSFDTSDESDDIVLVLEKN